MSVLRASFVVVLAAIAQAEVRISPDRPDTLQLGIDTAYRQHQKRIVIPPGVYRIAPSGDGPHLRFRDLVDFEIDARGVEFVFADQTRPGIEFRNCRNVALRGANTRYEVPPFTQGIVDAIGPAGLWYDVAIDAGYPVNLDDPRYFPAKAFGLVFDRQKRTLKPGSPDLNGSKFERLGPRKFRVHWQRPMMRAANAGDLVAFRGIGPHNLTVAESTRMAFDALTIFNAPAFAIWEIGGEGANRYTVTVRRGPRPAGATANPLLSATADAFHSVSTRHGPLLENCRFEFMGDDGIAIHGLYAFVMEARESTLVLSKGSFRPGDQLRLFDPGGHPAGEAIVTAVRPLPSYRNPDPKRKSRRDSQSDNSTGPYSEVKLNATLQAGFDYLASNPSASGSDYVLRRNTIANHRARGMLLKADRGLVENNIIDGSTMGGIVLTPEFWWNEACYSRNVVLRGNVIRRVASAGQQLGAVIVGAIDKNPVAGCGHRNIEIEGNRFEDLPGPGLYISSACGVSVGNNAFLHPQTRVPLIFVTEAAGVRFTGNTVSGSALRPENLHLTPSAKVDGLPRGITIH